MKVHGNYCGPNWSNGRHQPSVVGDMSPADEFDETCRIHDAQYALDGDLVAADLNFAWSNLGKGFLPTVAAMVVGAQGSFRAIDKYRPKFIQKEKEQMTPRLRGTPRKVPNGSQSKNKNQKTTGKPPSRGPQLGLEVSRQFAPASIGSSIRAVPPRLSRTVDTARIVGRDFIGTVEGQGVSTFGVGKSALLNPAYFYSTQLGNLARSFERYRWNKLRIHYVPKVATSAVGQIIMCSSRSVSEPCLQPEAGTFLPRAMSQGNAVFSSLWTPAYIDIDVSPEFKLVDPTTTTDLDDSIHEELQVYTQISVAAQVGYLFAEYDCSFEEPIYTPHSTAIPIYTGPGARTTLALNAAVTIPGDTLALTDTASSSIFASAVVGTIYRAVLDLQGSTTPGGTTFANALQVNHFLHGTTAVVTTTSANLPIVGGLTLYITNYSTGVATAYTSLEAAVAGSGSGQVFIRTATTSIGAFAFDMTMVRIGETSLPQVQ
jgi:hypothetical protein